MRDGSRQRFLGAAGLGTLDAQITLEGPITENTTILTSGRRGYPNVAMQIVPPDGIKPSRTWSSELIAKLTHILGGTLLSMMSKIP
jgi:hypothetical protein